MIRHANIITGLEERINFMLSSAERRRILEDLFPDIYTPRGHQIADIGDGCKVMIVMSKTVDEGIKEKFAAVADEVFIDKNIPGAVHDRITNDTRSFIHYIIDENEEVTCGSNISHGTFLESGEDYFYIYDLCTEKTHHRRGLAKALLHQLHSFAASTGKIKWLWLTVDTKKNNEVSADTLVEIYRRCGYEIFDNTYFEPHYIPMRLRAGN